MKSRIPKIQSTSSYRGKSKRKSSDGSRSADNHEHTSPVQFKKTVLGDGWNNRKIATENGDLLYEQSDSEDLRRVKVWIHLNRTFDAHAAKGIRNWGQLQESVRSYQDDKETFTQDRLAARAAAKEKYEQHYKTNINDLATTGKRAETWGINEANPTIEGQGQAAYYNKFNTEEGIIYGTSNSRKRDVVRMEDQANKDTEGYEAKGLPNSEIIWQQYFEAAKSNYWVRKKSRAKTLMAKVKKMIRENVINVPTQQVVFMSYPNGELWDSDKVWKPEQIEFKAILGAPNAAAAAFMLKDHMDEVGGKTISQIKTTAGQNLEIDFVAAPESEQTEEAEVEAEAAQSVVENNEGLT
jgi:hypothetical protein